MDPGRPTTPPRPSASGHVLIVDDDPQVLQWLHEALTEQGYEVHTARNGLEGLAAVRQQQPAVILLDLMMPVVDGAGFMELYRRVPGPHAPIVVLSVAAGRYRPDALAHAEEVLAKPFSLDRLLQIVGEHAGGPTAAPHL